MVQEYPRVAGRVGNIVKLNMKFMRNGVANDPFALRQVDIYRNSPSPANLAATLLFPDPSDVLYPSPASNPNPGEFIVPFLIPDSFVTNDIYFDVWRFVGIDNGATDLNNESNWISQGGIFWVFDDVWLSDDELRSKHIGFEPLDKKFRRGEVRKLEIAIHPLPIYDYEYNQLAPVIPQLNPTISIYTAHDELIISDAPCQMGVRQGAHRNSPFVVQCLIDTKTLLIGLYKYKIKVNLGQDVIVSPTYNFIVQQ